MLVSFISPQTNGRACVDFGCTHPINLPIYLLGKWLIMPLYHFTWAPCYFALPVMMSFLKKDIYVILIHILGRERCICILWSFINVFAFVSKHIEFFWDQIQMQCLLHMLLWKHHMMSCLIVVLHLHMCITSCSHFKVCIIIELCC